MTTANHVRKTFLDFFEKNGHVIKKSSSLVPLNDPTLMFTNAGMVQFKNVFTGVEKSDCKCATTTQKCVRAGGKHNDLENVGHTARHHTFFEMLGNFSFGDYFKEGAIELAWKLLTEEYCFPKEKLLVTVYAEDEEAASIWRKISGFSDSKIIRIPTSDNFWSMGATGPCGPCSEIFYDHGEHIQGGPPGSPDEDGDRFVEIWNLVFMQYDQISENERINLPSQSIDTGMGLERTVAALQGTELNYDIDMFRALIEASAEESHTEPYGEHKISHRVISDHLRSCSFLIADGVLPSNEGRGYVLRRIMRRAMRHAQLMGCQEPLMYKLVPALIGQMGDAFPELIRADSLITETLKLEEIRFKETLNRGLKLLNSETCELSKGGTLSGDVAFKLYDTYGFPLDLTQDALKSDGYKVDVDGFNKAMEHQKEEARKAWKGSGDAATEEIWFDLKEKVGATDFLGYTSEIAECEITALIVDGKSVDKVTAGNKVCLLANQTPFYGESGGQVGDSGIINIGENACIEISDTLKKLGDVHVHVGTVKSGEFSVGDAAEFYVNNERRSAVCRHHSVTHLLHAVSREILGDHVTQKGSLVTEDRLRFDVSHNKRITPEELKIIEDKVNQQIRLNSKAETRIMMPDEAVKEGAMALFGEKYGDEVRVVSMGNIADNGKPYSVELCGGTHVKRTGDIGFFKIISESAIAAGVRRIEAVAGRAAQDYIAERDAIITEASDVLKVSPADLAKRVTALIDERKQLKRELSDTRKKLALGGGGQTQDAPKTIGGRSFIGKVLENVPPKDLKGMTDEIKNSIGSGVIALIAVNDGKASLVVGVTDDLKNDISAVDLVRAGSSAVGGKGGGGRPDMAQAGGPDGAKAKDAITAIENALS